MGRLAEMSGASSVISSMWPCLRKGGHVVLVGLPKAPIHIEDPLPNVGECTNECWWLDIKPSYSVVCGQVQV